MDMGKFEGENKRFLKINFHSSFVNVSLFLFRILAPNSNFQDVETLYNFLVKYEVRKIYIIHIIFILFEYKYNKIAIGIFFK